MSVAEKPVKRAKARLFSGLVLQGRREFFLVLGQKTIPN